MKILNCYLFSVLDYGCESWTWNRPMRINVNAFERWCYRMILGISWRDHVSTPEVMERVQLELHTELHFTRDMIKRTMEYAGHVLRGLSGLSHLQILEGRVEGRPVARYEPTRAMARVALEMARVALETVVHVIDA